MQNLKKIFSLASICLVTVFLGACSSNTKPGDPYRASYHTPHHGPYPDPYQKYNRFMYNVNDKLDKYIMKPVATFYYDVTPRPLEKGINNALNNVDDVTTIINDLLQANFYQFTSDTWRFGVNTTIGIGGLFDPATEMGLDQNTEGFGLTLAKWGWKDSDYLVLPFFGPSTVRGTVAVPFNWYMSLYHYIPNPYLKWSLFALWAVNKRAQLLQYQNVFKQASLDPYIFVRNAYLQHQAYLVKRNDELNDPYTAKETRKDAENVYYLDDF